MILDVNFLINFFDKYSEKSKKEEKGEMGEQETSSTPPPASGGGTTGGGGGSIPKWADTVGGPTRGKANMLGKAGEKWSSGMNRGVANQIW